MAAGLVRQRNRNVAGNTAGRIVLGRNTVERQQTDFRAGQLGPVEKHRIPVVDAQPIVVRAGGDLQTGGHNQRRQQSFFELRADEYQVTAVFFYSFIYFRIILSSDR